MSAKYGKELNIVGSSIFKEGFRIREKTGNYMYYHCPLTKPGFSIIISSNLKRAGFSLCHVY